MTIKTEDKYQLCKHCNTPSPYEFCCTGCSAAYHLIENAGLKNYYTLRETPSDNPLIPEPPKTIDFEPYIEKKDDISTLHLMINGLHCVACVWLIETFLRKETGVISARLNMTTHRLTLKWQSTQNNADNLINKIYKIGYKALPYNPSCLESLHKKEEKELLTALAIAGFATANIMLLSVSIWAGIEEGSATRALFQWVSALIALPTVIYAGRPFFRSALSALKAKRLNMDVPISIAILTTTAISFYDTWVNAGETYFDSAVTLLFFLLIGRYLDKRLKSKTQNVAEQLLALQANSVTRVLKSGETEVCPIESIKVGDTLLVCKGERIPFDGILLSKNASVDNSLITGESLPVSIQENGSLISGILNVGQAFHMKVSATKEQGTLSQIASLIEQGTESKNSYIRIADRISRIYAPVVHILGAATFFGWWLNGTDIHTALLYAVAVLIVTCPCALALAVPAVQISTISRLMKNGIFIKNSEALEKLPSVTHIVFDKTGTLTLPLFTISAHSVPQKYLQVASALASHSLHPLSRSIARFTDAGKVKIENIEEINGQGISGIWRGKEVRLGSAKFCGITEELPLVDASIVFFKIGNEEHHFELTETLREDARDVCHQIEKTLHLLSGDHTISVEKTSKKVGITKYQANCTPEGKQKYIAQLQKNSTVMMVGDGLNDAPSLALADVSVSFSEASHISQNSADILLQGEKLGALLVLNNMSNKARRATLFNFFVAFGYNSLAIPLAMTGFITPLWAAVLMSSSSLVVLLNALRLQKVKI